MHIHFVALICFIGTILAYIWGKNFYQKYPYLLFSPTILIPCLIILCMMMFHIQYDNYMYYSKWLAWVINPTGKPCAQYSENSKIYTFRVCNMVILNSSIGQSVHFGSVGIHYFANEFKPINAYY